MRRLAMIFLCTATLAIAGTPAPNTVLYPTHDRPGASAPADHDPWSRIPWLIGSLALAAAGVWWMRRLRSRPGYAGRRLTIEETKSLGSRQYLVVANCDGQRLLLGVAPGRINLLCALDPGEGSPP